MRGHTLPELVIVLTLLAVGVSTLAPTARRLSDVSAVTSAREELVGILLEARAAAIAGGGSRSVVTVSPPMVRIVVSEEEERTRPIGWTDGIRLDLGGRDSTVIRFDALGIGRFASETIVVRRGGASAAVVVSSYGRVRRR